MSTVSECSTSARKCRDTPSSSTVFASAPSTPSLPSKTKGTQRATLLRDSSRDEDYAIDTDNTNAPAAKRARRDSPDERQENVDGPKATSLNAATKRPHVDDRPRPSKRPRLDLQPLPPAHLLLSLPRILSSNPELASPHVLFLSLTALRHALTLPDPLSPELTCRAWTALAEVGMVVVERGISDPWTNGLENEVEKAINKGLLIAQRHPSLRLYKHHLTLMHAHSVLILTPAAVSPSASPHQSTSSDTYALKLKFARSILKRLIAPGYFTPTDPPHIVYSAHLAYIRTLFNPPGPSRPTSLPPLDFSFPRIPPHDLASVLSSLDDLHTLALQNASSHPNSPAQPQPNPHAQVALLTHVLRVHILFGASRWEDAREALQRAETAFGVSYECDDQHTKADAAGPTPSTVDAPPTSTKRKRDSAPAQTYTTYTSPLEHALVLHTLVLGVALYTREGAGARSAARLGHLQALCDEGPPPSPSPHPAPDSSGRMPIYFGQSSPPLYVHTTPPSTLLPLALLVSASASRDAVGRRPKRAVFAKEGGRVCESTLAGEGTSTPGYVGGAAYTDRRLACIRADLFGELAGVQILRSQFAEAARTLDEMVAFIRNVDATTACAPECDSVSAPDPTPTSTPQKTKGRKNARRKSRTRTPKPPPAPVYRAGPMWTSYAPLVTLLHAQLAHAMGRGARAAQCYAVAAELASGTNGRQDRSHLDTEKSALSYVEAAARAGEVALRIGMEAAGLPEDEKGPANIREETQKMGVEAVRLCAGHGGVLEAAGTVLQACITTEIVKAKEHLKRALALATAAQDNHLRALVLALIAAHYIHTAPQHAQGVLEACEQLAAGLGAEEKVVALEGEKPKSQEQSVKVGNAALRLWIGERFLELYKRTGKEARAAKQAAANQHIAGAVERVVRLGIEWDEAGVPTG
ncbi:hypothetical protein PLICRDRAFT_170892 [Plicaturopsis crispa FD-325 SS-3]|nr:hypothetical protein PLICRDRAFT_170892 [Plicaturopsis crispa FD-325 SS-3]